MNILFYFIAFFGLAMVVLSLGTVWGEDELKKNIGPIILYFISLLFGICGIVLVEMVDPDINEYQTDVIRYEKISIIFDEETQLETAITRKVVDCVKTKVINNPYAVGDAEETETITHNTKCKN